MVKEVLELAEPRRRQRRARRCRGGTVPASSLRPHRARSSLPRGSRAHRRSTAAARAKDTRQVVFDLADTGLAYELGDALGVQPTNCPDTVRAIIECLGAKDDSEVAGPDGVTRGLYRGADAGVRNRPAVAMKRSRCSPRARVNLAESQRLQALAEGYPGAGPEDADLLELLQTFPSARPPLQELISALGALQPRLYSISSSPKANPGAVHLTVAAVRYKLRDRAAQRRRLDLPRRSCGERRRRAGLRAEVARLPPAERSQRAGDHDRPGHRRRAVPRLPARAPHARREGRNWLFFGDQHRASDFLYEDEITGFQRDGLLTELDLAFSRDQAERIYVQQRMRERANELWAWLEDGAYLYVCGSVTMGKDVDASLTAIIARQGGMGTGAAKAYLAKLAKEERYVLDVY